MKKLEKLGRFMSGGAKDPYENDNKPTFRRLAMAAAKELAKELGLSKDEYEVDWNPGGPAVLGEVTFHSNELYIMFSNPYMDDLFMYRSCDGMRDYHGGRNNWYSYNTLMRKPDNFVGVCRNVINITKRNKEKAPS